MKSRFRKKIYTISPIGDILNFDDEFTNKKVYMKLNYSFSTIYHSVRFLLEKKFIKIKDKFAHKKIYVFTEKGLIVRSKIIKLNQEIKELNKMIE